MRLISERTCAGWDLIGMERLGGNLTILKITKIALQKLQEIGVLYPCFCSRGEILKEIENSFGAPHNSILGPDGPTYPGTCRSLTPDLQSEQIASGKKYALRLDVRKSLNIVGDISWFDVGVW